jgi:hypothetical protein
MTALSPAAQSVFDAFYEGVNYLEDVSPSNVAAALKAAHDHLGMCSPYTGLAEDEGVYWACKELLTIATELEGHET